jgi:hypothetical protein
MANQRWWKVPEDDLHNVRSFQKQKQATTNKQNQKKKYTTHKYLQITKKTNKQANKNKANTNKQIKTKQIQNKTRNKNHTYR